MRYTEHQSKGLFDPHQLSDRWKTSVRTLERYRLEGNGPKFVRIGRLVRYRLADIEEYERQNLRTSTSQVAE